MFWIEYRINNEWIKWIGKEKRMKYMNNEWIK